MSPPTPAEWEALLLSARVGLVATAVALPPGVAVAWLLARGRFRGRAVVEVLVTLPLVLPPIVTGWGLLLLFGSQGPAGALLERLGVPIAFTWRAAALASAVLGFPLLVRAVQVAIEGVDPRLEAAARTLGAGRWRTLRTVTLPLARPGLLAGAVLMFARSVGEFGATITFAGNLAGETRTLPLAMYTLLQSPGGEAAAARLGVLSAGLAVAAVVVGARLGRGRGGGA